MSIGRHISIGTLLLALASTPGLAEERAAHAVLRGFEPTGLYALTIDGHEASAARIYRSQIAGSALLVTAPELPRPVLLQPRQKSVGTVGDGDLLRRASGIVDLAAAAPVVSAGGFVLEGTSLDFRVAERAMRVAEKPPLLGLHDAEELLADNPGYAYRARRYRPSAGAVEALRGVREPTRVRVYFGSWCPRCARLVPKALRLAQELAASAVHFEVFGLPRTREDAPKEFWREASQQKIYRDDFSNIPLAAVYRGKRKLGQVVGSDWGNPEQALERILLGGGDG